MVSAIASLIANLFDPAFALVAIALGAALTLGIKRLWLRFAYMLILAVVIGLFIKRHLMETSLAAVPSAISGPEENFKVWNSIVGTKYEQHHNLFANVRSQVAINLIKRRIDERERDCLHLVGQGPNLFGRCRQLMSGVAAISILFHMIVGGILISIYMRRRAARIR